MVCFPGSAVRRRRRRARSRHATARPFVARGSGTGPRRRRDAARRRRGDRHDPAQPCTRGRPRRPRRLGRARCPQPRPEPQRAPSRAPLRARPVLAGRLHHRRQRRAPTRADRTASPTASPPRTCSRSTRCWPTARSRGSAALAPDPPGYDLRGLLRRQRGHDGHRRPGSRCGSRPNPPVRAHAAARLHVARRRGRDGQRDHRRRHRPRRARDDGRRDHACRRGLRRRRATRATPRRCCSSRSTASTGGVDAQVERHRRASASRTARGRSASRPTTAERALLWKGRKSAFGAIARIAPDYYLHDAVVPAHEAGRRAPPRSTRSRTSSELIDDERLPRRRRQPAPAARLRRPRARDLGAGARPPATRSCATCVDAGGVLSGEHGIGLEKRDAMPLDLRAPTTSTRRRACATRSIPTGRANPREGPAARAAAAASCQRCPGGRVDLIDRGRARGRAGESVARGRRGRRPVGARHALGGRRPARRDGVARCARRPASSRTTRPTSRSRVGAGTPVAELDAVLGAPGQECPLDPRDHRAPPSAASSRRGSRARAACASARCATACSRCASSPPTAGSCKGGGPTVKNVTGYDLPRLLVGSLGTLGVLDAGRRCGASRDRHASAWRAATADARRRSARAASARRRMLVGRDDARTCSLEGDPGRRRRRSAPRRARPTDGAAPPTGPTDRTAAASRCGPARSPRSVVALDATVAHAGSAEVGVGTVHVATDDRGRRSPARTRGRDRGRRLAAARGRCTRARRLRRARCRTRRCMERIRVAFDPDGQAQPGPTPARPRSCAARPTRGRARRSAARRGRAGGLRRVRAVPAALPDLPRHRPRDRVARAAASRRCAPSQLDGRAAGRPRSPARWRRASSAAACEAACPSSVPFGHLMEGDSRRAPRHAARRGCRAAPVRRVARLPGRAAAPPAAPRADVARCRSRSACTSSRGGSGCPRLVARSLRTPLSTVGVTRRRRVPVHRLRHGRVAARHAPRRDARSCARGGRLGRARRAAAATCCGALHMHAGRVERGAPARASTSIASMPGDARVVVDSAGCGAAMKDYGQLARHRRMPARSRRGSVTSRSGSRERGAAGRATDRRARRRAGPVPPPPRPAGRRVRCAPCSRPAYELVETDDDGLCCGAGGAYACTEPALSRRDPRPEGRRDPRGGRRRRRCVVASANPGCGMHLARPGVDVRHPAELLAAALDEGEEHVT